MTVAVVGGLDRLSSHYAALAHEHEGLEIRVFNSLKRGVGNKLDRADGVILVTNLISHTTAREVYKLARQKGVPVVPCHRCGVTAVRDCLSQLSCSRESERMR